MTETERLMGGGAPCNRSVSSRPPLSFLHTSAPIAPIPCPIITHLLLCFLHTTNLVPCIFCPNISDLLLRFLRTNTPFPSIPCSIITRPPIGFFRTNAPHSPSSCPNISLPSLRLPRTNNPLTPICRCDTIVQTICIHTYSAPTVSMLRLGSIHPPPRFLRIYALLSPILSYVSRQKCRV